MMKKNNTKGYMLLGILFCLVSITAHIIPMSKTATFWVAYIFTVIAFAIQIIVWKVTLGKAETLNSKFLKLPIIHISIVYLFVQIAILIVFVFKPLLPTWSAIIVCCLVTGVSAICMVATDIGVNEIKNVDTKVDEKISFIKKMLIDVEIIANNEDDINIKSDLLKLAEKFRFSDPVSNELLSELEDKISLKIVELNTCQNKKAVIMEINSLLDERNKKCKIFK